MSDGPTPTTPNTEPGEMPADAPPKGAIGIIFLIVLLDLMGFGIIIPLLPFYVQDPKANPLKVTLLFSVFSICQFIGAPVLGAISDRKGRVPILAFSQLGSALGYALLGFATQKQLGFTPAVVLALVYLSRIIDGFTGGNISTAQAYISDVTTPANRSKAMAAIGAAFGLGFSLGPFLGGVLGHYSVSLPAYVAGAFSLLAALMTFIRLPESRVHKPLDVEAWLHPSQFKPVLRKPVLVQLLLIGTVSMASFVMMESTVGIFLMEHYAYDERHVGWFFGYIGFIILIVQGGILRRLAKGEYDWPLAVAGPLLVTIGMAVYATAAFKAALWVLLLAGFFNAVGRSLQGPTMSSLISKHSGRDEQGVSFGLYNGLTSLARVIGPLIAGLAYPFVKNAGPFLVAGAVTAVVVLWTAMLKSRAATPAN